MRENFEVDGDRTLSEVTQAFIEYLRDNDAWRTRHTWNLARLNRGRLPKDPPANASERLQLDRQSDRRCSGRPRRLRPRLLAIDPLVRLHGIYENHAGEVTDMRWRHRVSSRRIDDQTLWVQ